MDWTKAKKLIEESITINTDVNSPKSTFRSVKFIGSLNKSKRYGYLEETGFLVQIGSKSSIKIPWKMLEECFVSISNGDGYDGKFFRQNFLLQA